jgi:hypothetical protein
LRSIQERGCGRRDNGADVAAGPDDFLQARTKRDRIDRRCDHRAGLGCDKRSHLLGLPRSVAVGDEQSILQAAILCGCRQPLIDALHEFAPCVLREGQDLSRPGGGRHTGAAGSNGARVLGMVMPDGPLCAADGADAAIKPSAKTGSAGQMASRHIAVLPGNIVVPHGLNS